jgi:hypothetical protein
MSHLYNFVQNVCQIYVRIFVQDIAVTPCCRISQSITVYYTSTLKYAPTRQWREGLSKLWRIHDLISPPLYNPIWKGNRPHSPTDGYVLTLFKKILSVKIIKLRGRNILRLFLRSTDSCCFKVSRDDCIKPLLSLWSRVEQFSIKINYYYITTKF